MSTIEEQCKVDAVYKIETSASLQQYMRTQYYDTVGRNRIYFTCAALKNIEDSTGVTIDTQYGINKRVWKEQTLCNFLYKHPWINARNRPTQAIIDYILDYKKGLDKDTKVVINEDGELYPE